VRIAYVITRADAVGGASVHVRDLARAMLARGHEVIVFLGGEGHVTEQLLSAGVPFQSLRFLLRAIHPVRDLRAVAELTQAVREFNPNLLSLHTAKAGWIGRVVASRLGIPALYTPHGWPFGNRFSPLARLAFRFVERAASKDATAVLCVCEHEKELAVRLQVSDAARLRLIYNGVHDVPPEMLARPATSPARIVSVARFAAPKDHETLLGAMALLGERPWELDLVGEGPGEAPARALARTLGIGDRVRFLGYQPDPAAVLARAQIFVLSTRSESFPRSVLEAMRAGLPVVASRVGGVPEAVADGANGFTVPPGDPALLAGALSRLLGDGKLRQQLGLEARRCYEARFRFERMAEETLAAYNMFAHRIK
jgi:glycosyltransferase involved in cell wall biosynthesis